MLKNGWCCIVLDCTIIYSVVIKACSSMFYLSIVYYFSSCFYNGAFNFLPGSYIRSGEPIFYWSAQTPTEGRSGKSNKTVTYARHNQTNNMQVYIDQKQQKQNNFLENIPNKIPVQLFTFGIDFWVSICQILTFINFLSNKLKLKPNKSRKFQVNDFFYKPTILGQTLGLYFWDFRVPLMMNVAVVTAQLNLNMSWC